MPLRLDVKVKKVELKRYVVGEKKMMRSIWNSLEEAVGPV